MLWVLFRSTWALKHAKRPSKQTLTAKKVLEPIFFGNSGPLLEIAVPKRRGVSGSIYKYMVLKKLQTKITNRNEKRPKTCLQHVHLLHDNALGHKSSTVAQFLTSEKVSVLSHPPYSPDLALCGFFLFPRLKKKNISRRRFRSRSALGSAVHQFLMGVPKISMKIVSKNGLKDGNTVFWLKGN